MGNTVSLEHKYYSGARHGASQGHMSIVIYTFIMAVYRGLLKSNVNCKLREQYVFSHLSE